jgi:hypothetical protein
MEIYVFKTSVQRTDFELLKSMLDSLIPRTKYNFDFEDCDQILRIESKENVSSLVCNQLKKVGYYCEEL